MNGMIITKEELMDLIERLTDEQTEYVYYLLDTLFCQGAN